MTLATCRIIFEFNDPDLAPPMTLTHWGVATWLEKEMRGIKEQMRGPEAKGGDIVNFVFTENPPRMDRLDKWTQLGNSFEMKAHEKKWGRGLA